MSLTPGARLGPYEITAQIGAGGMGEVYRARDTRLQREVAIKVLPPAFSQDADRLRRFEQEALATAALNHPNILAVYDVGAVEGVPYVVSELLQGRTLRDEIADGSLPVRRALDYGAQIAKGLSAAHERGIVHRDLKPENVFVTKEGLVKILDFGLAKLKRPRPLRASAASRAIALGGGAPSALEEGDLSSFGEDPTVALAETEPGLVLGTIGYMSPEQVRGLTCDHRSDLFSFGAMLYEMVTGQRAFRGATPADTMTAILREDPAGPPPDRKVPPALTRIVLRCLDKGPERRFQSTPDLVFALETLSGDSTASRAAASADGRARTPWRRREIVLGTAAAACALGLIGALTVRVWQPSDAASVSGAIRFTIASDGLVFDAGTGVGGASSIDISPDGLLLVFVGNRATGTALWLRPLDSTVPRQLPGTDGAIGRPFWSPDGRAIGFFADGKLRRIDLTTLAVSAVTDVRFTTNAQANNADGTWNADDVIVFGTIGGPLFRVPAAGGERSPVTVLNAERGEGNHLFPRFLPDGRHFVYVATGSQPEHAGIYLGSLDGGDPTRVVDIAAPMTFTAPGYLLFLRGPVLMAQAFDMNQLRPVGDPSSLGEIRTTNRNPGGTALAASDTGVLVLSQDVSGTQQFVWVDRAGRDLGTVGPPGQLVNFDLTADDGRLVYMYRAPGDAEYSIWNLDLKRNVPMKLAAGGSPVWSPDGRQIAFARQTPGGVAVAIMSAAGGNERVLVEPTGAPQPPDDWSPDGKYITFNSDPNLKAAPVTGGAPFPFVQTAGKHVDESHFSWDGKWIAYNSDESGRWEVYVKPWPPRGDDRWQISAAGGVDARWHSNGRELYYLSLGGQMMVVDVNTSNRFEAGIPQPLFDARIPIYPRADHYAVTSDGARFLIRRPVERGNHDPWTVIVNWPRLLGEGR